MTNQSKDKQTSSNSSQQKKKDTTSPSHRERNQDGGIRQNHSSKSLKENRKSS